MKLGLHTMYSDQWIAGLLYLENIIQNLRTLPESLQPQIELFLPRHIRTSHVMALKNCVQAINFFDHPECGRSKTLSFPQRFLRNFDRVIGERLSFESTLKKRRIDIIYPVQEVPSAPLSIPWIGWIPDFQHRRLPEYFNLEDRTERDARFKALIEQSSHLVVSSEDARKDLFDFYDCPPAKVSVYHFCVTPERSWFSEKTKATLVHFQLPQKYLYFPGQFWRHKNHLNLFKAILSLKKNGISDIALVLTGKDHDYRSPEYGQKLKDFIKDHHLESNIYPLGLLSRKEQIQIMRAAAAVVQPSYFEGWSMLVEESRTLGKRLYLSDIPVHREQKPPRSTYFDPHDPEDLAARLLRDWPTLTPGPDQEIEKECTALSHPISVKRGREFLAILNKVLQPG